MAHWGYPTMGTSELTFLVADTGPWSLDYPNRVASSRRLERDTQRNVELMWLTERLAADFKTIADFRRDNGQAIRNVCREFVDLCQHHHP